VEIRAALAGVELWADDGELMERVDDAMAKGRGADEAEDGDHHEQEGVDRRKAVPSQAHHQRVGLVVAELPDHRVAGAGETIVLLPAVDGRHQSPERVHGRAALSLPADTRSWLSQ
jgi:hypothetical protein